VARLKASFVDASDLTHRMLEWLLVSLVILGLVYVYSRQMESMRVQVESSAIRSTLGALRTSFVLSHLKGIVKAGKSALEPIQQNPFELLEKHPANYRGEMGAEQALQAPAGSWVFDPVCVCVGYLPIWSESFESPSGERMAWFQVSGPEPLQLTAKEAYRWQGQLIN
jgi:hypothetical protein